jgi:hypothetical protein
VRYSLRAYLLTVGYVAALLRIGEVLVSFVFPRIVGGN